MKIILESNPFAQIPYLETLRSESNELSYLTLEEFKGKFNCEYFEGVQVKYHHYEPITF